MMYRKRYAIALVAFGLLLTGAGVMGNETASARFRGGAYDGYDHHLLIQSDTDWETFPERMATRNRGGAYDGYAATRLINTQLPPRGTTILIR